MAVGQDRWLYKALGEEKEKTFATLPPCPHRGASGEGTGNVDMLSMALQSQGPLPRSTLPTNDRALLHVSSV